METPVLDDVRAALADEASRRWIHVAREAKRAILGDEALGVAMQPAADRADLFKRWLDEKLMARVAGYDGSWLEPFVDAASARGVRRVVIGDAQQQLAFLETTRPPSAKACHAATVSSLAGVCEGVSAKAHAAVASGLLRGARRKRIARHVDLAMGDGLRRTRMLAEHSVTQAFTQATLDALEASGVTQVGTISERRQRAALRDYDPDQPRDKEGKWTSGGSGYEFVSPNVGSIGFGEAKAALASRRESALLEASADVDRAVGAFGTTNAVIGAWADGAEHSTMTVVDHADWDTLRLAAAIKGHLADQKQVLIFKEAEGDERPTAALYSFEAKGDLGQIHQGLLDDGVAFHTLEPHSDGATVWIADPERSVDTMGVVQKAAHGAEVHVRDGQAEFLGTTQETGTDREQRDDARRAYEGIIAKSPVQGAASIWQGLYHRWGQALAQIADALDWLNDAARKTPQPQHPKSGKFAKAHVVAREKARSKKTGRFRKQGLSPEEQRKEELTEARFGRVPGRLDVLTAGDDRVCDVCDGISAGGPYSINEARSLIPAHLHCRCLFVAAGAMRDAEIVDDWAVLASGDVMPADELDLHVHGFGCRCHPDDDGGVVVHHQLGDFDPDEPRNKSGEWTSEGTLAYHGTGADFSKFDLEHMGRGEGSQIYGYGLYLAEEPKVAEDYKTMAGGPGGGSLYTVRIHAKDDEFVDWDKPLSEQSKRVRDYVGPKVPGDTKGEPLMLGYLGMGPNSSAKMAAAGIKGVRYLDRGSRDRATLQSRLASMRSEYESLRRQDMAASMPSYAMAGPAGGAMAKLPSFGTGGGDSYARSRMDSLDRQMREATERLSRPPTHNYVVFDPSVLEVTHKNGVRLAPMAAHDAWVELLVDFDPNEPRDPQGKWTAEGGGAGASAGGLDPEVAKVGGDEWNKQTAERLEREWQSDKPKVEAAARAATKTEGEPEPEEDEDSDVYTSWDDLAPHQQDEVKEQWKKDNESSFYDSEVDSWWQSDEPGYAKQAKLVDDWNDGETDWAEDAMKARMTPQRDPDTGSVMASSWEEDGHKPLPLPLDKALEAVLVSGSDYGEDLKFQFDTQSLRMQLEKAHPELDEPLLPGFDKPDPLDLFSEPERDAFLAALKEEAGEHLADIDIEAPDPDYFADSVEESLESSWDNMDDSEKFAAAQDQNPDVYGALGQPSEPKETGPLEEPGHYDPLNDPDGDKADYRRTQAMAKRLFMTRAQEIMAERHIPSPPSASEIRSADNELWSGWKDSSTSDEGLLLQVAIADELGGRLRTKEILPGNKVKDIRDRADDVYAGGYAAVKAMVRAKWETTQYMLDKAGVKTLQLYRTIRVPGDLKGVAEEVLPEGAITSFDRLPKIKVERNGAASFTASRTVANDWDGSDRVVLRLEAPRTAAVSVPAYGVNVLSEREVVMAGTAWKRWDAWDRRAPPFDKTPLQTREQAA